MGRWILLPQMWSEKIFMDLIQKVLLQEHYFMQKVREATKSSELHKLNDSVQVDEFTIDRYLVEYSFRINRSQNKINNLTL